MWMVLEVEFGTGYAGIPLRNSAFKSRDGFRMRTGEFDVFRSAWVDG